MSQCTNVQVIFSQGAKLHSFPNKLPRYILQEEWKVFRNIVVFCNIQKHNFFYFLARIEYMKQSSVIQGSDTKKMTEQCIILFKRGSKPFDDSLSALNFSSDFKPMLRSTDLHLLLFALNVLQIRQHR